MSGLFLARWLQVVVLFRRVENSKVRCNYVKYIYARCECCLGVAAVMRLSLLTVSRRGEKEVGGLRTMECSGEKGSKEECLWQPSLSRRYIEFEERNYCYTQNFIGGSSLPKETHRLQLGYPSLQLPQDFLSVPSSVSSALSNDYKSVTNFLNDLQ